MSKVSCGSFFLRTSLFPDEDNYHRQVYYADSIIFLTALFITRGMANSGEIIKYEELESLVHDISYFVRVNSISLDDEIDTVAMSQKRISEVLEAFKGYFIRTFIKAEEGVLKQTGIVSDEIIDALFCFCRDMYNVKSLAIGKSFKEYIDDFESLNKSNFEYTGKYKEQLSKLSLPNGGHKEFYSSNNPVSSINRLHCCFLNIKEKIYCFIPDLITAKLPKFLRHIIPDGYANDWFERRKEWSEESVRRLFENYFIGASIHQNNFYGSLGHRLENDILVDFKGFLFVVEVKAENVTPDSVFEDEAKVSESFSKQVLKGVEQCNTFCSFLKQNKQIELLFENNQNKNVTIKYDDYEEVFKITVTFEEMGSYLPGFFVRNKNVNENIVINFYDLLIVFDYLSNPILIIKYLRERKNVIPEICYVCDELVYLGLFTLESVHYSETVNAMVEEMKESHENIGKVFLPPDEFARDIENYYSSGNQVKKEFNINSLIRKVLDLNFRIITNKEFLHLVAVLDMDKNIHERIEKSFNNPDSLAVLRFSKDELDYAICIKPTKNSCLKTCAQYFESHTDLKEIVIVFFQKDSPRITTIRRTNPELKRFKFFATQWNRTSFR